MSWMALRSMRVQLVLLIVAALALAQVASLMLLADERSLAVRAALGFEAAGRAANVARLIEEAPRDLRPSILRAANSPLVRFEMGREALVSHDEHFDSEVEARVRTLLGDSYSREIRVEVHEISERLRPLANLSPEMSQMHVAMMRGELSAVEMTLSIALTGGDWLNVSTRFEAPPVQWPRDTILSFALSAATLLVVALWFAMTRLMQPLRRLAGATDRLGRGENIDPLPVRGPLEVRELTLGFNRMQDRLSRLVEDRTRMLAALGHDLRSPLTAMRVRAELVDEAETRESLIASVEEMQAMVDATLSFARGLSGNEAVEPVDMNDLLDALQAGMVARFSIAGGPDVTPRLRPQAMRRALRNLVENALRYGGSARVSWHVIEEGLAIEVEDDGPGIPEAELERVFDPFHRLETSRSLETGGNGLGLSITRSIVAAHGGTVSLHNRSGGGLLARVVLPMAG